MNNGLFAYLAALLLFGSNGIIAAVIASAAILFANFFMWVSSRE